MTSLPSPGAAASGASATCLYKQVIPSAVKSWVSSPISSTDNINKRKRRPAGTPDADAEVVALSPKTLMESDRYVWEICNQGFHREQNLQMHRRRHNVACKLLKRSTPDVRKRVFVCPDPTCLHNDPCHALGDLVGIKKHFRRKHSMEKQWKCERCSKGYPVQSDYKAHLKTCGNRGYSCDCGRVFSRVETFIEHQDHCIASKERATYRCNDRLSQPRLTVTTSSSNVTVSRSRSGLSLEGRPFNYGMFYEHKSWLQMEDRELQFLSASLQSHTSETTLAGANNGSTAVISRNYINSPPTDSRWNQAGYNNNINSSMAGEEDMSESGAWLQLSIGPCSHYEKKRNVPTGRRPLGLTLSLQNISVHPIQ